MQSLVTQPGEPLLTFGRVSDGSVAVTQKRFFLNPKETEAQQQSWTLPVCMKSSGHQPDCPILSAGEQRLKVPQAEIFYGNAGGKGYYRSRYDTADYQQLLRRVESSLTPSERVTFLGSQWALAHAGIAPVGDYLNLAAAVRDDTSPFVIDTVTTAVRSIDQQVASTPQEHAQLAAWVRKNFAPALSRLGLPAPGDVADRDLLRATLFELLGDIGADPQIIHQALQISQQYLRRPASVDATLAARALKVAAQNGDSAFFAQLQEVSQTSGDPQLRNEALQALARFRDPALVIRAMDYAMSAKVRNQDAVHLVRIEMSDRRTRDTAWQWVQQNWPQVETQITTWAGGTLVESTGNFCSADRSSQVADFLEDHKVLASARALDRARDNITDCVDLRASQGSNLSQWLRAEAASGL
jgi:aminopeptidase N/puromycin-sensitive aminopeptidase